jgi:ABC-type Na+ efflux pump permease subunit
MTAPPTRGGWSAALVVAQLSLVRLARGRAVWVSAVIAALPVAFASFMRSRGHGGELRVDLLVFELLTLAVLPSMFVASSIGEDLEDRTSTYLWSRPVPRWAVLAGKLLALAPLASLLVTASWIAAVGLGTGAPPTVSSCLALAGGGLAIGAVAGGLATLVPRHGMPLTIAYMLFFDLPVGLMPVSLAELSVTHHIRAIAEAGEASAGHSAIGLAALGGVWLAVAVWRMRRLEA